MAKKSFLGLFTDVMPSRNSDRNDDYRADIDDNYDEYDDLSGYNEAPRRSKTKSEDDDIYYTDLNREEATPARPITKPEFGKNITQINQRRGGVGSTVIYVDPEEVDVAYPLVGYLKDEMTIILSLAKARDDKEARRIVDFMSGAACALEGTVQRVAPQTFVITPNGVENIDKRTN